LWQQRTGFDVEVPGLLPDGSCCRELAAHRQGGYSCRKDLQTATCRILKEENFNTNLIVPFLDRNFTILYGWASVDVEVQGRSFRFVTTHLEPILTPFRQAQVNEILQGPANTTLPVVLVCDCNSNANEPGHMEI